MTGREQSADRGARVGDVYALAEALSWTSGEMTRYSPTAHEDHNRWSWRGTGHGSAIRQQFLEQAAALAPIIEASARQEHDHCAAANERAERWKVRCEEARATVARIEALVSATPVCDWHKQPQPECRECIGAAAVAAYDEALRGALGEQGATSAEEAP